MVNKELFKQLTKSEVQLRLLEYLVKVIDKYSEITTFISPIEGVETPRDLALMLDTIYYTLGDKIGRAHV